MSVDATPADTLDTGLRATTSHSVVIGQAVLLSDPEGAEHPFVAALSNHSAFHRELVGNRRQSQSLDEPIHEVVQAADLDSIV
jgi:hypothetical protein